MELFLSCLCGFWRLNLGCQTCRASLFAELSGQPTQIVFISVYACSLIFSFLVSNLLIQIYLGILTERRLTSSPDVVK